MNMVTASFNPQDSQEFQEYLEFKKFKEAQNEVEEKKEMRKLSRSGYSAFDRKQKILEALWTRQNTMPEQNCMSVSDIKMWIKCNYGWMKMETSVSHLCKSLEREDYISKVYLKNDSGELVLNDPLEYVLTKKGQSCFVNRARN